MLKQGIRFINMSFCILNFLFYSIVLLAIEGHVSYCTPLLLKESLRNFLSLGINFCKVVILN